MSAPHRQPHRSEGFTLLEMLVAVVIVIAVVGLLTTAFLQGQRGWVQSERRNEAYQYARRILGAMAVDLQTAFATTNNGTISFRGSGTTMYFTTTGSGSDGRQTNQFVELAWVGYEFVAGTPSGMPGYLLRKSVPPDLSLLPGAGMGTPSLWRDHVYDPPVGAAATTGGANNYLLTTNVVLRCEFSYYPTLASLPAGRLPRCVRIRVETVDLKTVSQFAAGAPASLLESNKYVLESQVYLWSSR